MKPQVSCLHEKGWCYDYKLIGAELNLCERCEKRLREQMFKRYGVKEAEGK